MKNATNASGLPVQSGDISKIAMSIFKACDIRGRYGRDLTPQIAERLGRAVGTELGGRSVVVGGDLRPSTLPLKQALIGGLMGAGCRVVDTGILPTPAFYFAKDLLETEGGVMVTGSHNPPGDNGFKIVLGQWPITEEELATLRRRMELEDFVHGGGKCERVDVVESYKSFIAGKFPVGGDLKVVVDAGNGCYSRIAPEVLGKLGYRVVELFCEPDGTFPGRHSNPAIAANLHTLCETVVTTGADLGMAFDGDGDRVVFVDQLGRIVASDYSIVLFARYLLRREAGEVVYDLKCSSVVPEQVRQAGGTPLIEKSGHAFIKMTLLRRKALLGGEISGHFFFGDIGRDDGLYAALVMLQLLAEAGRDLAALADTVPHYPNTPDIRLPCSIVEAQTIVQELGATFAAEVGVDVDPLDGVRIVWPDGWALIRPSVTEALISLRFEAHSQQRLAQIQEAVITRSPGLKKLMA
jgi:phosphomannomutase/phosphoglucomutase